MEEELNNLELSPRGEQLIGHARGPIPPPLFPSELEAKQRAEFTRKMAKIAVTQAASASNARL